MFPQQRETKVEKLLDGLGTLWRQNPNEKVVIFATYLGTVDLLGARDRAGLSRARASLCFAAATTARSSRRSGGSGRTTGRACWSARRRAERASTSSSRASCSISICHGTRWTWSSASGASTATARRHTAQVYNLVLSDTIEGRIFLLLDEKLKEIARTLGKVDEHGNVAEDLRAQILGQLSERLNYDRLYQEALSDPELRRTQVELEAALSNATRSAQGGVRTVPGSRGLQPRRLQAVLRRLIGHGTSSSVPRGGSVRSELEAHQD